jgi:arsenate reductase (glutaredoxin)
VTILVDPPVWTFRGRRWSHLVSDADHAELHAFAAELGLPPRAFHRDHYDVPDELLDRALALGAVPVDGRELVRRLRAAGLRRRRNEPLPAPTIGVMAALTLFHNPRCSNSRKALAALEARGVEFDTVLYLKEPLSRGDLERLVGHLDGDVADLVRHDARFAELGLDPEAYTEPDAVVDVLAEHPELMQRPVLDDGDRAAIARPPEAVVARFLGDA